MTKSIITWDARATHGFFALSQFQVVDSTDIWGYATIYTEVYSEDCEEEMSLWTVFSKSPALTKTSTEF